MRGIHRWIPHTKPVTRSFDVFFDLCLNNRLSKQPWGWWFETPSWSLWRQCNVLQELKWRLNSTFSTQIMKNGGLHSTFFAPNYDKLNGVYNRFFFQISEKGEGSKFYIFEKNQGAKLLGGGVPPVNVCVVLLSFTIHPYYSDVIMGAMASQITSLTVVCSTVCSGGDKKKTSKLRVTGLCAGSSPVTCKFPTQMGSYAENVSIWWRHHGLYPSPFTIQPTCTNY